MKKTISILGFCLDLRVVVAIALVAAGIFILAPRLFLSALPILALLACPLSMLLMMRAMNNMSGGRGGPEQTSPAAKPNREQQLVELQEQLERVQSQQAAIARHLEVLSESKPTTDAAASSGNGRPSEDQRLRHS